MLTTTEQQAAFWIRWLQEAQPKLTASMRKISHHYDEQHLNGVHLEGDIWTHTMMVLQSYVIKNDPDTCVGLCALLHDIGKPEAMFAIHAKKRRAFKGHEGLSAWMSWSLLADPQLQLTLAQRQRIFTLVALHGSLYQQWFDQQLALPQALAKAFYGFGEIFWQQLLQQVHNDMRGQVTDKAGMKANLMQLEQPVIDIMRGMSYSQPEKPNRIVFLIGVAGSGKSTYRKDHLADYTLISRDELLHELTQEAHYSKAWQRQREEGLENEINAQLMQRFTAAVTEKCHIVVDMTNLSRSQRQQWLAKVPTSYHKKAIVWIDDAQILYQRNQQRGHKSLPEKVIKDMLMRFEHPLFDEFDEIEHCINQQAYPVFMPA